MVISRRAYIERFRRLIYNGQPSDDASISINLVNYYLGDALATAAKTNYKENLAIDGIRYVNNSFYTVFKGLAIVSDDQFMWKVTLPEIPVGLGSMDSISTVVVKDNTSAQLSFPVVLLSQNEKGISRSLRTIPNKLLGFPQGKYIYLQSTLILSDYTVNVTMVSGGDSTDLDSDLNVPPDYLPIMDDFLTKKLLLEKAQPLDAQNDGQDFAPQQPTV